MGLDITRGEGYRKLSNQYHPRMEMFSLMELCFLREARMGRRFLLPHPLAVLNFTQVRMAVSLPSSQNSVIVVLLTRLRSYLRIRAAMFSFLRMASLQMRFSLVSLILTRWALSRSRPLHMPLMASYSFHFSGGGRRMCLLDEMLMARFCTFRRLQVGVILSQILMGSLMMDLDSTLRFSAAGGRTMQPLLVTRCRQENISPSLRGTLLTNAMSSLSILVWMMVSRFWLLLFALKNQQICMTRSYNFLAKRTSFSSLVAQLLYREMTAMNSYSWSSWGSLQAKQVKCSSQSMRCWILTAQNLMILLRSVIVSMVYHQFLFYRSKRIIRGVTGGWDTEDQPFLRGRGWFLL